MSNNNTSSNNSKRSEINRRKKIRTFSLFGGWSRCCPCIKNTPTIMVSNLPRRCTLNTCFDFISVIVDGFVYLLGPILIGFASMIICGLTYCFFNIVLPMLIEYNIPQFGLWGQIKICLHVTYVLFLLINVVFNYVLCVTTSNKGKHYDTVVRQLAYATGFQYPETTDELTQWKRDYEDKMIFRMQMRQQRASQHRQLLLQKQRQQKQQISESTGNASENRNSNLASTNNTDSHQQKQSSVAPVNVNNDATREETNDNSNKSSNNSASKMTPTQFALSVYGDDTCRTPPEQQRPPDQQPKQPTLRRWMMMGPQEWGFCTYSNQPKPPRSHYDHVTKLLVLNMDHYCPWMFNTIGYFNYRYFVNFLFYVFLAMAYGTILTFTPFRNISGSKYFQQIHNARAHHASQLSNADGIKLNIYKDHRLYPLIPLPKEKTPIAFSFMLCLSVGLAVACLGGFHLYLILTAQTTIEFHGNHASRSRAKKQRRKWKNPYDLGMRRNWQQVYGTSHPLMAILPSSRQPQFLPLPLEGDSGNRRIGSKKDAYTMVSQQQKQRVPIGNSNDDEMMNVNTKKSSLQKRSNTSAAVTTAVDIV